MIATVLIAEYFPIAFLHPYYYGVAQLFITMLILYPLSVYSYRHIEIKGIEIGDKIIKKFNFGVLK